MGVTERHRKYFQAIIDACYLDENQGTLIVAPARRRSDGETVALLCVEMPSEEGMVLRPLAELFNGNPLELYDLTTAGGELL